MRDNSFDWIRQVRARKPRLTLAAGVLLLPAASVRPASAQRPTLSAAARRYVALDTDVVALTHGRVIDGTGAPAKPDQTLIIHPPWTHRGPVATRRFEVRPAALHCPV